MKLKARLKSLLLIDALFAFTNFIIKSKLPCLQLQLQSAPNLSHTAQTIIITLSKIPAGDKSGMKERRKYSQDNLFSTEQFQHATGLIRSITYH